MSGDGREKLLTVQDVADWLMFGKNTVREMCAAGEFRGAFQARNEWRIPEASVKAYIAQQQAARRQ